MLLAVGYINGGGGGGGSLMRRYGFERHCVKRIG